LKVSASLCGRGETKGDELNVYHAQLRNIRRDSLWHFLAPSLQDSLILEEEEGTISSSVLVNLLRVQRDGSSCAMLSMDVGQCSGHFCAGSPPLNLFEAIRTIFTECLQELGLDLLPQVDATIVEEEGDASGLLVEAARYVLDAGLDNLLEAGVFYRTRISQAIV
jgi:hypothetical protein